MDAAIASAAHVVEGTYETGAQEQLYIEPNGMIAIGDPVDGVTIWGSMQCPYYIHKALAVLFGIAGRQDPNRPDGNRRRLRRQGRVPFGDRRSRGVACLEGAAGPVKLIYDRAEDMVATTKRHPSRTRHRTAVDADGRLVAMDIDFVIDGGAYCTLSPVVLSRGTIHAAGPYFCPNVRIRGRAVATNAPPHGAFRGFGAPQSIFALERQMDRVAEAVGLSPEEFRRRNFIQRGQTTAVGQVIDEPVDMSGLLDRALELSGYAAKRSALRRQRTAPHVRNGDRLRGVHARRRLHRIRRGSPRIGRRGGGRADGRVRVLTSSTEIGQGTNTIFAQIAARRPRLFPETPSRSSNLTRRSCPTADRRSRRARAWSSASSSRPRRSGSGARWWTPGSLSDAYTGRVPAACRDYIATVGPLKATARYQPPPGLRWDDEKYQGDAYGTYAWAVYVAEVTVDPTTFETRVDDFVAVQEVGKVINPVLATGQIEGGVAQGIGWALYEKVVWREGRMVNGADDQLHHADLDGSPADPRRSSRSTRIRTDRRARRASASCRWTAPAPAIFNAVAHATGVDPTRAAADARDR